VAVSVDPPLSQRDIDLLKSLYRYTPKVAVLLTKVDLLSEPELEKLSNMCMHSSRELPRDAASLSYSTKPGFEHLREALEAELAGGTLERFAEERESILMRKIDTLLGELSDFLALSLKSAEVLQSERQALNEQLLGEKEALDDVKSVIRLLAQNASAGARADIVNGWRRTGRSGERVIRGLRERISEMDQEPGHHAPLVRRLAGERPARRAYGASDRHRDSLLEPLRQVRQQTFRVLQQFRDRLSDRAMRGFGVPLRTTETEIDVVEPSAPSVRIGRVFDRTGKCCRPFCLRLRSRPWCAAFRAFDPLSGEQTSAGSARSGKKASMARFGASRRKPGGAWMN